jgi:hypothetical protein
MRVLCEVYIILSNLRTGRDRFVKLASIDITTEVISMNNRLSDLSPTAETVSRGTLATFAEEHRLSSVDLITAVKVSMQ